MTQATAQSKSLLAKLLATENITMQQSLKAKTASFDIKNRTLTLPIWQNISNDLQDMLVVHEVGHALDTPLDGWIKATERIATTIYGKATFENKNAVKSFLNIVEDARIDKRQKRRYPGSRRNYINGYKELIDRDFFGTANREINSYSLIDRINIYFKGGVSMGIKFSAEENAWVKKVGETETFSDVVEVAEKLFAYCKEKGEEQQKNTDNETLTYDDEDSYEYDDGDDYDDDDYEEVKGKKDSDDDGEDGDEGEDDVDSAVSKETEKKDPSSTSNVKNEDFIPEAKTEEAWQKKQRDLASDDAIEYMYLGIPKVIMENIVVDYKTFLKKNANYYKGHLYYSDAEKLKYKNALISFRKDDNITISYMVKEFEMRKAADIFSRISIAKTGVIDTNKIHSYKYNEDIFRRQSVVPTGKNHGFVMVLDWSGSMLYNLKETIKQLISLTSFCKRVQIPFEVYSFRDGSSRDANQKGSFEFVNNDMIFSDFKMTNVLSSRMSMSELTKAYELLWMMSLVQSPNEPMGGTPLNAAIIATEYLVKMFQSRSKVQIVNTIFLTDGDSIPVSNIYGMSEYSLRYDHNGKKRKLVYILQDKVMKKDYHLSSDLSASSKSITINLLKILKDRTQCNLIGFYLHGRSSFQGVYSDFFGYDIIDTKFKDTMKKSWNEDKFMPVSNHGYDDYYIINSSAMKYSSDDKLNIQNDMSNAKIAQAFRKFSEKKSVNRVLLQRFITKIASEKKVA